MSIRLQWTERDSGWPAHYGHSGRAAATLEKVVSGYNNCCVALMEMFMMKPEQRRSMVRVLKKLRHLGASELIRH